MAKHFDVALYARINLEMIGKMPAESCDLDGLALAYAANIYARRGVNERIDFARPIINNYDESEWQIIDYGLSDLSGYPDKLAFGRLTYGPRCDREGLHSRAASTSLDVSHIGENEQSRAIGEFPPNTNLLPNGKP